MRSREIPVLAQVIEAGADDPLLDSLLLVGPLLIAVIILVGRSQWSELAASAYLGVLVGSVIYRGVR